MDLIKNAHIKEYQLCVKTEVTTLSTKKNIEISVGFPEKKEGGMFNKSFISYLVTTQPFNYQVRKRYNDFVWLRSTLKKLYINCVIPPIPKKNYGDRFSDKLIEKRSRFLKNFLQSCVNHPLLRHSEILFCFLSMSKKEEFEPKKQEYNKKVSPFFVKNVKSLTGEVKTKVSPELETYFINTRDHSNYIVENLQKVTKAYKSITVLFDEVKNKMNEVSKIWEDLYILSQKYYEKIETVESFRVLSEMMKDWGNIQKIQSELININLREFFRYIKNEYKSFVDMTNHVENSKSTYNKYAKNLIIKKENLFKTGDISKWDLNKKDNFDNFHLTQDKDYAFRVMLPKETMTVENLKQFYGFYLNSCVSEYERLKELNANRYQEKITDFNNKLSNIIVNFHVSLADFLSNFDQDIQKKKVDFNNEEEKLDVDSKDIIT
jgi:flagellar biosynthesis chaperone FliJ